jgi:predicted RNA binding protein with dsRBD fold (UPF0201 family)
MALSVFRQALRNLADVVEASGTKKAAEDVRAIATVLPGPDERQVGDAIADLERLMKLEGEQRLELYVAQLNAAGTDRSVFERIVDDITKNKRVTKQDADAIAHGYTRGRTSWKTRKAAIDAMKTSFDDRSYQAAKMKIVDKAKVW